VLVVGTISILVIVRNSSVLGDKAVVVVLMKLESEINVISVVSVGNTEAKIDVLVN